MEVVLRNKLAPNICPTLQTKQPILRQETLLQTGIIGIHKTKKTQVCSLEPLMWREDDLRRRRQQPGWLVGWFYSWIFIVVLGSFFCDGVQWRNCGRFVRRNDGRWSNLHPMPQVSHLLPHFDEQWSNLFASFGFFLSILFCFVLFLCIRKRDKEVYIVIYP